MAINGTKHRTSPLDLFQRCKRCARVFYFSRNCNGQTVVCPHCGANH